MEQKNGIQNMLMSNGILFKVEEQQGGLPEIISEETFINLLQIYHWMNLGLNKDQRLLLS